MFHTFYSHLILFQKHFQSFLSKTYSWSLTLKLCFMTSIFMEIMKLHNVCKLTTYSYILIKVLIHLLFTSTDETLDETYMSVFHIQLVQSMFVHCLWVLCCHFQCLHIDVSHVNIARVCPLLTIPDFSPCFCNVLTATFDAYVSHINITRACLSTAYHFGSLSLLLLGQPFQYSLPN